MTDGWPGRAGRSNYGPQMQDERHTVDSRKELNANSMNLSFWQLGAMGLAAPKAMFAWSPVTPDVMTIGSFAWDQTVYLDVLEPGFPSYLNITTNGTGDFTFTFDSSVLGRPDETGIQQLESLGFVGGGASPFFLGSLVAGGGDASFELVSAQVCRIRRSNLAGTLVDQPTVIMLW